MDTAVTPVSAVGRSRRSSLAGLTPAKRAMSITLPYGTFWVLGAFVQ
jgi:hypothetical protein